VSLASALKGIKEPKTQHQTPVSGRVVGKRSNPDYEAVKVLVRKDTRRIAARKWEDEGGRDLSDLIQKLLNEYIGA